MRLYLCRGIIPLICLVSLAAVPAHAQTQALDFTGGVVASIVTHGTVGWEFSLSQDVTVADLGFYDSGNDGLVNTHQVGIWDSGGTLLASTTLASGMSGDVVMPSVSGFGSFRYKSITPLALTPGTYFIGGEYLQGDADTIRQQSSVMTAPEVTYLGGAQSNFNAGFAMPDITGFPVTGFFGPNFLTPGASAAAPEPASLAFLGMAALPLAGIVRRRKA